MRRGSAFCVQRLRSQGASPHRHSGRLTICEYSNIKSVDVYQHIRTHCRRHGSRRIITECTKGSGLTRKPATPSMRPDGSTSSSMLSSLGITMPFHDRLKTLGAREQHP